MDSLIKRPIKGDMGILVENIFVPAETIETSGVPLVEINIPAGSSHSQYCAAVQSGLPDDGDLRGGVYIIHFAEGDFDFGTNKLFGEEDAPNSAISDLKYYNGTILFRGEGLAKTRIFTQHNYPILLDNDQESGRAPVAIGLIDLYLIHRNKDTGGNQASVLVWNRTGGPVFLLRTMLVTTPMLDQSKGYQRAVGVDGYVTLGESATDAAIGLVALESALHGFNRETLRLGSYVLNYIECCYIMDGAYALSGLTKTYLWIRGGTVTTTSIWQLTDYRVYWLSLLPIISTAACCYLDAPAGNSLEDGLVLRASLRKESATADTGQTMTLLTEDDGVLPSYEWYKGTIAINTKLKSCLVISAGDVNVPLASEWTISVWTVSNRSNVTLVNIAGFTLANDRAGAGAAIYSPAARTTWVSNAGGSLAQLIIYTATDRDVRDTASIPPENCNCDKDWHMVCVRYYKNMLELYVDGRLMSSNPADLKNETFQFMIGFRSGTAGSDPVDEYISDVRLYNRALSIAEINQLCLTRAQDPEPEPDLNAGLVLHAPLASEDEIIATGQTYTETGTVTYTKDASVPCAYFDQSSWYNVTWEAITGSIVRTISAWIKYTGSIQNDWREATMWGTQSNNRNFGLSVSNGNYFTGGIYGSDVVSEVANDDEWHHLLFQYDGQTATLYIDGVESASKTVALSTRSSSFYIGYGGNTSQKQWKGCIADVRVYNRILRPKEIASLSSYFDPHYEAELDYGLLFHAPLSSADNVIATGQSYTETGTVTYTTDATIPCAVFDGNSWYDAVWDAITGNAVRTISAWMKYTGTVSDEWREATMWGEESNNRNFGLSISNTDYLAGGIYGADLIGTILNDGEWHNLLFQYNGQTASLYIDGVFNIEKTIALNTSATDMHLGYGGNAVGKHWVGYLADVRVYNRKLNPVEIPALAKTFVPSYEPDISRKLLFYLPMSERSSQAATGQSLTYYSSSRPVTSSYEGKPGLLWQSSGYNYIQASLGTLRLFSVCWWQVPDSSFADKTAWSLYNRGGYLWCLQGTSLYNGSQHLSFPYRTQDDELHFCCVVYNGNGLFTLYVDGENKGTLTEELRLSPASSVTLRIGNRSNTSGLYYKGWMSRFRVYSRVLSQEEVLQLYQEAW